jgi:hypothetical protein
MFEFTPKKVMGESSKLSAIQKFPEGLILGLLNGNPHLRLEAQRFLDEIEGHQRNDDDSDFLAKIGACIKDQQVKDWFQGLKVGGSVTFKHLQAAIVDLISNREGTGVAEIPETDHIMEIKILRKQLQDCQTELKLYKKAENNDLRKTNTGEDVSFGSVLGTLGRMKGEMEKDSTEANKLAIPAKSKLNTCILLFLHELKLMNVILILV